MKKIVVIDGAIFGLQRAGGISRIWAETLLQFEQTLAQEYVAYLLIPKNLNEEWRALEPRLRHFHILKRRRFKQDFFIDSLYLTKVALSLKPSLWHSTYYVGFPFFAAGHKLVTFHDMIPERMGMTPPKEKALSLKKADTIVSISHHSHKDLLSFWPEFQKKSVVIPNGVPEWKGESLPPETPYFIYVGKRGGYKNFSTCMEQVLNDPRFASFRIKVIGGESHYDPHPRIDYIGLSSYEQVQRYMAASSLLLFPSLYEGFGLPLLEAFTCGIPVLAMRASAIPEVVGEDYPLADPLRPHTIGDTIATLLREKEKWAAYGKERKKLYSCEKMASNLERLYRQCAFPS